jgi:hypothetical protein
MKRASKRFERDDSKGPTLMDDEHDKLARAVRQVEAITGFYIHLVVFVLVMVLLLIINMVVSPIWWVQWPFLGWGLGVLLHAFAVFGQVPRFIVKWQLKKIKELKDKM